MTTSELKDIIKNHKKWLNGDVDGQQADLSEANLRGADLFKADLSEANLRGADLSEANLRGADLKWADLSEANLSEANLRGADLRGADLSEANLSEANLRGADLFKANLRGADLRGADLSEADLKWADLSEANLSEANLRGADLRGADLSEANLRGAHNVPCIPMACPDYGSFIGWKKVISNGDIYLVKLQIPEDAKRSSSTGRKCRCDKAIVVEITNLDSGEKVDAVTNKRYIPVVYKEGEIVYSDCFDENRFNECSHGIHFFINRQEAEEYNEY